MMYVFFFFFSSRRRHTRSLCDWSSDVCSSDLPGLGGQHHVPRHRRNVADDDCADHGEPGSPRRHPEHDHRPPLHRRRHDRHVHQRRLLGHGRQEPDSWFRDMTLNRVEPNLPASAMKTYQITAPLETHFRTARCEEVRCDAYLFGWRTVVDPDGEAAAYIRHDKSRRHTETREPDGRACFTFEPGQQGFPGSPGRGGHDHRVRLERPGNYVVKGGEFKGKPEGPQRT